MISVLLVIVCTAMGELRQKSAESDNVAMYLRSRCCIYSSERVPEQERDEERVWRQYELE